MASAAIPCCRIIATVHYAASAKNEPLLVGSVLFCFFGLSMKLSVASDDGQRVCVAITGQVTQRDLGPLDEPLVELLGHGAYARQVRLDLSDTNFMDSSGVGWLLACHKRMRQAGGKLTLHAPHPVVANVLRVLKLEKVLEIEQPGAITPPAAGGAA